MEDRMIPDERGLEVARRLAGWEIGDRRWADKIIQAYLNPEEVAKDLDFDEVPEVTGVYR